MPKSKQNTITEIQNILKNMNRTWFEGNPDDLKHYFHKDMIILSPDMKILGAGRENCIKSYKDFLSKDKIIDYTDSIPEVHLYEHTAIAAYYYNISWKIDEKFIEENGQELYVLNKNNDEWLIVMRKLVAGK